MSGTGRKPASEAAPVLVLAGSLRRRSVSLAAAGVVAEAIEAGGIPVRLITVRELDLPPFDPDVHRADLAVSADFLQQVRACPAMVWAAPAYNGTVGGSFKNALDYLDLLSEDDPPFITGKAVGLLAASGGVAAAVNTVTALDMVVRALRGYVIPYTVPVVRANRLLDEEGRITDDSTLGMLRLLAREVAGFVRSFPAP